MGRKKNGVRPYRKKLEVFCGGGGKGDEKGVKGGGGSFLPKRPQTGKKFLVGTTGKGTKETEVHSIGEKARGGEVEK